MQIGLRAAALRTAIERATHTVADVAEVRPGRVRISASISPQLTIAEFRQALIAVQSGDDWGSRGTDGHITVWSDIIEEAS